MYRFKDVAMHNQIKYGSIKSVFAFKSFLNENIKMAIKIVNATITINPKLTRC